MAYTWAVARDAIGRMLSDAQMNTFPVELRQDGYNAGLHAFAAHTALPALDTLAGDGSTIAFAMPTDMVDGSLMYVWDSVNGNFWTPEVQVPTPADVQPFDDSKRWWIWPTDTLNFSEAPGGDLTLFYFAYWPEVDETNPNDEIAIPIWAREAVQLYACAYCLNKTATSAANIRQYGTKTDSGNPEHNPMSRRQEEFLHLYDQVIGRYSQQIQLPPFGVIE